MMTAKDYAQLFRVWPMRADKTPLAPGFGADKPQATWDPNRFKPDLPVGILCGPLNPALGDTGFHILGLDLDKAMTREKLEDALGCKLPETLTSKGWRHAYYFIPSDHPLHQRNGAITCEGGALDIRPCAGGYLIEKGDWDRGFDPQLIAEFPAEALAKLHQFVGEKRARDGAPAVVGPVQISDRDRELARDLAELWAHNTTGDRAFGGLGGWLARRGVSRDRAEAIAGLIAELTHSTHPDPLERVAQAYDGDCPLGRPALQSALAQGADECAVLLALDEIEDVLKESVPGFSPPSDISEPEAVTKSQPGVQMIHGLRVLSGDALRVELPPTRWLCRDLQLCPGRPPVLAATANAGKSWSLQCMAMSIAMGTPIFGRFTVQTPGPVLHVCTDAGERATIRKYQQIARAMGVDIPDNLSVIPDRIAGCVDKFGAFVPKGFEGLARLAEQGDYRVVILDSMFAICAGIDMMAPEAGNPLYRTKDDDRVWLWTMHIPKAGGDYFGSAAIGAAAGTMWGISKTDREDEARLWENRKRSEDYDGDGLSEFLTTWDQVRDPDGTLIAGQILYTEPDGNVSKPKVSNLRIAVEQALKTGMVQNAALGLSQGQLMQLVEAQPLRRVEKLSILQSLIDSGWAVRARAGKSWMYHPGSRAPEQMSGTRSQAPEHESPEHEKPE